MSFRDDHTDGLAKSLGKMQLRIHELEEGGAPKRSAPALELPAMIEDELRKMRQELDRAKIGETRALLQLGQEKRRAHEAEAKLAEAVCTVDNMRAVTAAAAATAAQLRRTQAQLADAERALRDLKTWPAAEPLESQPTTATADLEAKLRGKDMQISELKRKVDELEHRPPEVVVKPAEIDCQVCKTIKLMVLGVEPKPAPIAAELITAAREPVATPRRPYGNHVTEGALRGIAAGIRSVLAAAEAPLTAHEIGRRAGIPAKKVQTNIPHLRNTKHDKIIRLGKPGGYGWNDDGYRYWLASRPLPDGFQA